MALESDLNLGLVTLVRGLLPFGFVSLHLGVGSWVPIVVVNKNWYLLKNKNE
jgi:hypothetical protein